MKDLYTENFKISMKEIEEDTNKWKDIPWSFSGLILLKCPSYPKQSVDSMQSLSKFQWKKKIPMAFFTEREQTILKLVRTTNDP